MASSGRRTLRHSRALIERAIRRACPRTHRCVWTKFKLALRREAFQNLVRGQQPPKQLFKMLANAAQDLNYALEGLGGAEPVKIIRGPAAGLCGAIKRVAPSSTVRSSPAMPPEYPTSGPC